jgi:peptidoglycan/LPS O-acetylase OafA/YrhL
VRGHRSDIDGLRGIAVISVVLYHFVPTALPGGFIGVDVFFVISGYLITKQLVNGMFESSISGIKKFYVKRIRRLFPSLILVLASTLAFGQLILFSEEKLRLGQHTLASTLFAANLFSWSHSGYFEVSSKSQPLLHLWSLGIEEQFYIIWPLFIFFAIKYHRKIYMMLGVLVVSSLLFSILTSFNSQPLSFFSPLSRGWELAAGGYLAIVTEKLNFPKNSLLNRFYFNVKIEGTNDLLKYSRILRDFSGILGISLLAFGFFQISEASRYPGFWALVPVVGVLFLLASGESGLINNYFLSNRLLVFFGAISYSLYLWHWPLLVYAKLIYGPDFSREQKVPLIIIAILLAWLSTRFIEMPLRYGENHIRLKLTSQVSLMFLIGALGLIPTFASTPNNSSESVNSQTFEELPTLRNSIDDYAIGGHPTWFEGKRNWLFLGNEYASTISKLELKIEPSSREIIQLVKTMQEIASQAKLEDIEVALIVGPDKHSIYPEFLPDILSPSPKRYLDFFLADLSEIENLKIIDPTSYLIGKKSQGVSYYRTDSHWNARGAFYSWDLLLNSLSIKYPNLEFRSGPAYKGDLIGVSKLQEYPVLLGDNWIADWPNGISWKTKILAPDANNPGASSEVAFNLNPVSRNHKNVWIVGDSFTDAIKPYAYSTFERVTYLAYYRENLPLLVEQIKTSTAKPDLIIIVRVERNF